MNWYIFLTIQKETLLCSPQTATVWEVSANTRGCNPATSGMAIDKNNTFFSGSSFMELRSSDRRFSVFHWKLGVPFEADVIGDNWAPWNSSCNLIWNWYKTFRHRHSQFQGSYINEIGHAPYSDISGIQCDGTTSSWLTGGKKSLFIFDYGGSCVNSILLSNHIVKPSCLAVGNRLIYIYDNLIFFKTSLFLEWKNVNTADAVLRNKFNLVSSVKNEFS